MRTSRLQENSQKRMVRSMIIAIVIIIVLLIFIIGYGPKLLIKFSVLMSGSQANQGTINASSSISYVPPPILNQMESATNSANIQISGSESQQNVTINLYVNGQQTDQTGLKPNNSFSFNNVTLTQGSNTIEAKANTTNNTESAYSNQIQITYDTKAPSLTVSSPQDGQSFNQSQSPVTITGKTDPGVQVIINGAWAIVDPQGNFTYSYTLQSGDNDLKIQAIDAAGNTTLKEIHIKTS